MSAKRHYRVEDRASKIGTLKAIGIAVLLFVLVIVISYLALLFEQALPFLGSWPSAVLFVLILALGLMFSRRRMGAYVYELYNDTFSVIRDTGRKERVLTEINLTDITGIAAQAKVKGLGQHYCFNTKDGIYLSYHRDNKDYWFVFKPDKRLLRLLQDGMNEQKAPKQ